MDFVYLLIALVLLGRDVGHGTGLCGSAWPERWLVNAWEWIAALVAAGLLVYLVAALFFPEDFT